METFKILVALPPILLWCGVYLYLTKAERRLKAAEARLDELSGK